MWAIAVCFAVLVVTFFRWRFSGQGALEFVLLGVARLYGRFWKGCSCKGRLPIPPRGQAAIIIANHTCSADAAFLQTFADRFMGHVMAREYYDDLPQLRWLFERLGCVVVKRDGMDVTGIRRALRRLKEGRLLGMWPEGGLSGAANKRGRRARCGVALLALRSSVPIVPVYIAGGPRHHHVVPAWLIPSRARLYPGKPVNLTPYRGRRINRPLLEEVTHYLMNQIFALDPKVGVPSSRSPAPQTA